MAEFADAVDRWKEVNPLAGLHFDEDSAQVDMPHPMEPEWRVWARYVLREHRLVLIDLRVFPNGVAGWSTVSGQIPPDCADGITAEMLRDIRFGDLFEPVSAWAGLKTALQTDDDTADEVLAEMAKSPNPGRGRRPDRFYAEWARRIHDATTAGSKSPIQDVADEVGTITREQLRDLATEARKRKLYAPRGRGKGGGYLTGLGQQVLEKNEEKN